MAFDGNGMDSVPPRRRVPHYYGDAVRVLFVTMALVLIVGKSVGADIPLTNTNAIISAAVLVLAAGITNPAQRWIHYINALLALVGTLMFGVPAVERYSAGVSVFDISFATLEALVLLSIIALYFTSKTIRGLLLRPEFQ